MKNNNYEYNVFINCPFDQKYNELFKALIFTIRRCNYIPRCAKESTGTNDIRIIKIIEIIKECKYSIHDLSETDLDDINKLPRFNMPLELGIFIGNIHFGFRKSKLKKYLILDSEQFRYQKYISDISGQDIKSHGKKPEKIIEGVRNWLADLNKDIKIPSATFVFNEYLSFQYDLPELCKVNKWSVNELTYNEYISLVDNWIELIE